MIFLSIHDNLLNIHKIEQRLIQIFAYFIGTQFLHELMYLGMDYAFKFSNILNLENIKGNFYMSGLLYKKNLFNIKSLFKDIFNSNYITTTYNSFELFTKFYTLINKINPLLNILNFIIQIGARSNKIQYKQVVGMRGLLNTSRGYLTNIPLLHNFERGLTLTEYLVSSYGVRKGLLDTSLQTSESGYLTRRLVEVIQDIIIKEHYCGSEKFLILRKYNTVQGYLWFPDYQLVFNKYLYNTASGREFYIKSPILCYSGRAVCAMCVGFSCNMKILRGESAGVIFGELLGEPSTQLTLRTFHTGGILNMTNNTNNFYIFKHKLNYKSFLLYFKTLFFKTKKNTSQKSKLHFFNKYKIILSEKYYKKLVHLPKKFITKILSLDLNQLVIYKFNFCSLCPVTKSYSRNLIHSYKPEIYNILLNVCSINVVFQNKLKEWAILLLNNSLNYCIFDYIPEKFMGGVSLTKQNLDKSYIIFSTNIIY